MVLSGTITLVTFLMTSSLILLILLLIGWRHTRLEIRLQDLTGQGSTAPDEAAITQIARSMLPKMGTALIPTDGGERTVLQARLLHAGLYSRQAMVLFLGVKMLLMVIPALIAGALCSLGLVPMSHGLIGGGRRGLGGIDRTELLARQEESPAADQPPALTPRRPRRVGDLYGRGIEPAGVAAARGRRVADGPPPPGDRAAHRPARCPARSVPRRGVAAFRRTL